MNTLRRIASNPRMFRATSIRAYSTAGYGNVTSTPIQSDQPPLDVEDPQDIQAAPRQSGQEIEQQAKAQEKIADKKAKSDHDKHVNRKQKDLNQGNQDAVREYSQGCD